MGFEKRKAVAMAAMNSSEPDKSPKGNLDAPIIPLLNAINAHSSFFTTSSCSGRISILSQPNAVAAAAAAKKKAKGGTWVFISHEPAEPNSVLDILYPTNSSPSELSNSNLVFRFEPLIVAVECRDVSSAQSLVSLAISCGFRESGITSVNKRVIVAIRCSIRLEVPLGDDGKLLVSPDYVSYLVGLANEKMEANRRRTDNFLRALLDNGFGGTGAMKREDLLSANGKENDNNGSLESEAPDSQCQMNLSIDGRAKDRNSERSEDKVAQSGSLDFLDMGLCMSPMEVIGQSVEKLFLWGHSSCNDMDSKRVFIFGGFGGMGRHARRNDCLLLDPFCGKLEAINSEQAPSPRLGHTASMVEDLMFVVGGRADPVNILNDVWVFNTMTNKWKLLECTGNVFHPRHRHAAAVVGSKIFVFGGLDNDMISSALHVLDTKNLEWNEISGQGEWPCARHSHSLIAHGSQLFMFGGYDGERALGDLYTFDIQTCIWKKEEIAGQSPFPRFSHSMFIYKNYLGIIGGCPIRQHYQELSLLDFRLRIWKHVKLNSIGKDLFVRCTANLIGDDLVMIGGGASCYAFGTKFSQPMKLSLLPVMSLDGVEVGTNRVIHAEGVAEQGNQIQAQEEIIIRESDDGPFLNHEAAPLGIDVDCQMVSSPKVLQIERGHAKLGKDILKKFGWLDVGRKVYSTENGICICFPVTENFCFIYHKNQPEDTFEIQNALQKLKLITAEATMVKHLTCSAALDILKACGGKTLVDEFVRVRKVPKSPLKMMREAVTTLLKHQGLPLQVLEQLPTRWERLGSIIVLPVTAFKDAVWDSIGKELWPIVAESLGAQRLARQGRVAPTGSRDSSLELLVGDSGWVDHHENGITYSFDATKCMFSWGNLSEKLRMAHLDCKGEIIVDLFAGIGYFVLPFLVRANAKLVYACEWNPHAIEALKKNLLANSVEDRCVILEGDNRATAPKGVADRVSLGLLPTSEGSWIMAVRALRNEGGILHVHGIAKDSEEALWIEHVKNSINEIARSEGYCWDVSVQHVERVKWYAPHIRHLVIDIRCKQIQR